MSKFASLLSRFGGLFKFLCFVVPVALAILIFNLMQGSKPEPKMAETKEISRTVRVITAEKQSVVPRVLGYGEARPGRVWRAVSRVSAQVVEVHEEVRNGGQVKKDEVLLRLDESALKNEVARLSAEKVKLESQIAELDQQLANDKVSADIEKASLELAKANVERSKKLAKSDAGSKQLVDDDQRTYLAQRQTVQNLLSRIALVPSQRDSLSASIKSIDAQLASAKLDLSYAVMRAPFDCVIPEANIQLGQFLAAGEALFEAYGTDSVEIDAQVSYSIAKKLLTPEVQALILQEQERRVKPSEWAPIFKCKVKQVSVSKAEAWDGLAVATTETNDSVTRTLGLVVAVKNPYKNAIPGERPPLIKGAYCQVEVSVNPIKGVIVVPRSSVNEGITYVVDKDSRLRRRQVEITFEQSSFAVIASGIEAGDQVLVTEPLPAIEGMKLNAVLDEPTMNQLRKEALGETPLR